MKNMVKQALILFVITLVAGFGLGAVYHITKEPRVAQEQKIKNKAYRAVFTDADDFKEYKMDTGVTKALEKNFAEEGIDADIDAVMIAENSKKQKIGYVITVTDNEAYDGKITFSVGIKNDGTVNGISFLSISETPGLGMRAKEDDFMSQFSGKKVESFHYTKTGAAAENEIDAISGATITSNAVTNGVNAAILCFHSCLGGDIIDE